MSYGFAPALQEAIYQRLIADATVMELSNGAVYDAAPPGPTPGAYVTLGAEDVRDASDASGAGARHDFTVSVVSDGAGFYGIKQLAAAVSDAVLDGDLVLDAGRIVGVWFRRATAQRREKDGIRRIDLRFRARVSA